MMGLWVNGVRPKIILQAEKPSKLLAVFNRKNKFFNACSRFYEDFLAVCYAGYAECNILTNKI